MIEVRDLVKRFTPRASGQSTTAVDGVSLDIPAGTFFTLLGPSGCGKSTSLRMLAGLERPDEGEIRFGDRVVFSRRSGVHVPSYRRRIGMVFQSYAIWPHMTVSQNVEYPLNNVPGTPRLGRAQIRQAALAALRMVGMDGFADRPAPLLSGGEQQRVALARALVQRPDVLLLDEPLSNLDAKLRHQMRFELRDLQKRLGVTTVFVTHDQDEAFALSDQMAIMWKGRVMEVGAPAEVFRHPRTPFVAEFLGAATKIEGRVAATTDGQVTVDTRVGEIACSATPGLSLGAAVWVYVRPEDLWPLVTRDQSFTPAPVQVVRATITQVTFLGTSTEWRAESAGIVFTGRSQSFTESTAFIYENVGKAVDLCISAVRCLPSSE